MEPIIVEEGVWIAIEIVGAMCGGATISEVLPFIGKTKSNGILHLGWNLLKAGFKLWKERDKKRPS